MSRDKWDILLDEARGVHLAHPQLAEFCAFPDDIRRVKVDPHQIPAARLMEGDTALSSRDYAGFRDAFIACSPEAPWRETYKDTAIGEDFLCRFGCYELIGFDSVFRSQQMRSFVVYAPAGLYYTWHHHPAEELYMVVAGEAEFHLEGDSGRILRSGDTVFHERNRPHAMTTHDQPVMAYVLWRNEFNTPPVLTELERL
ncbi:MAG: dimethylsulfonioproprionate lyase family protein [Pseudomonadota bacterium]